MLEQLRRNLEAAGWAPESRRAFVNAIARNRCPAAPAGARPKPRFSCGLRTTCCAPIRWELQCLLEAGGSLNELKDDMVGCSGRDGSGRSGQSPTRSNPSLKNRCELADTRY